MSIFGAFLAYSLFSSDKARMRTERSGMESAMLILGMAAFGMLFISLF